nr:uncharacterized protein LOC101947346 isoform X2 [Chrysemys picta bellii]XP_042710817.1 uncharacterized protein LOC101947346 isoform X2 [Chrysemys picta bellii]
MRRKQRAAEAGGAGLALELRWEWQDSGGTWHRFVPEQSEVLTQAARAGKPSVAVGSRVDLRRMVQRDGQTGQDRCVAAAVQDQDSYFVWCWQGDEEGQWLPCRYLPGAGASAAWRRGSQLRGDVQPDPLHIGHSTDDPDQYQTWVPAPDGAEGVRPQSRAARGPPSPNQPHDWTPECKRCWG